MNKIILIVAGVFAASAYTTDSNPDTLFEGFREPPAEARPFMRWWWNGDQVNAAEISRELDLMKAAGIGGVEINPIAMPEWVRDTGAEPLVWMSREWNDMVAYTSAEAKKRGMITDLIVGSGWPFGGEFLKEDQLTQRVLSHTVALPPDGEFRMNTDDLFQLANKDRNHGEEEQKGKISLLFANLVPQDIGDITEVIDVTDSFNDGILSLNGIQSGYDLVYGILQIGHRSVFHGAPGAAGPVMDHYRKEITLEYLGRLEKIGSDTGIPLRELIRALFCDSIELSGANWTTGMNDMFHSVYGYRLEPYYSFIFYEPVTGYPENNYPAGLKDRISRVRYDFNRFLASTFLDNFTRAFQDFCTENGVKARYQAYGTPFYMGMSEGYMIPDIPDGTNWIYSEIRNMEGDEWSWSQSHGYMIRNLYASTGAHLAGRNIVACEAMTNTAGVFRTSLDEIKRHDDMNFISGINSSVLHGFNYSPPEAGIPGWVRYGTYFSEHNTWWPYLSKWVAYNARLSHVFQQSSPVKSIAVLHPEADLWSEIGLSRPAFNVTPWYSFRLWESISQAGSSCDYINERVISEGRKAGGKLGFGPMSYELVILNDVRSLRPETAEGLLEFIRNGGKVVAIDNIPVRSPELNGHIKNDARVRKAIAKMQKRYPSRFIVAEAPLSEDDLLPWTLNMMNTIGIEPDVAIDKPSENIFQIHQVADGRDIYFFNNTHRELPASFRAIFPTGSKMPWVWCPETGTRRPFSYNGSPNELGITLHPAQSLLLVFEPEADAKNTARAVDEPGKTVGAFVGPWNAVFAHMNGHSRGMEIQKLKDISQYDEQLESFAGVITYHSTMEIPDDAEWIKLGKLNKGIVEVSLNGTPLGICWYGEPLFAIDGAHVAGNNELEIKYTSITSNYFRSLKDDPTVKEFIGGRELLPNGLEGEVLFLE